MSLWDGTLASLHDRVAREPVPAGVSVAAISASLGLSLLIKVLTITGKRPDLIDAAKREANTLARAAEDDIAAFTRRDAVGMIEIPMTAARSAVAGLDLCGEAAGVVRGPIAADVGAAAILLTAAVRGILRCVDSNTPHPIPERRELEERALKQERDVLDRLSPSG